MRRLSLTLLLLVALSVQEIKLDLDRSSITTFRESNGKCFTLPTNFRRTYFTRCNNTGFGALASLHKNTSRLTFDYNVIPVLKEPYFASLSKLTHLNLQNNEIEIVKSIAFKNLSILEDLRFRNNSISSLDDDTFKNCPMIRYLDLSFNKIARLTALSNAIASLKFIEKVNFYANDLLVEIDFNDLSPLRNSSLSHLNLGSCQLQKIASGAFSYLSNLSYLVLSSNPLTETEITKSIINISEKITTFEIKSVKLQKFPTQVFKLLSTTQLQTLYLDGNNMSQFDVQAQEVPVISTLLNLHLSNCNIAQLHYATFRNLKTLQELYLQNNKLSGIEKYVFTLPNLRKLRLSNNANVHNSYEPFYLGKRNFMYTPELQLLELSDLKILVLERYALTDLYKLRELYIERSLIDIESFAFSFLKSLQHLDLSENYLTFIRKDTFYGLGNLTFLSLLQNKLTLVSDATNFNHLPSLEVLDLSENEIEIIPSKVFSLLPNVKYLFLTHNKLVPWHEQVVTDVNKHLRDLSFFANKINYVTPAMLADFEYVGLEFDLSDNPYNCSDCRVYNFAVWLNETDKNHHVTCAYPEIKAGKAVSSIEKPSHCFIESPVSSGVPFFTFSFVCSLIIIVCCIFY